MAVRTHLGVSLDGFFALPDGEPAWEAVDWDPVTHGVMEFTEQIDALIMGRTSFDQGFKYWRENWPWPGKQFHVLTSKPLPDDVPDGVFAASDPAEVVQRLRAEGLSGDIQVHGGAKTVRSFLELGEIDEFGVVVLPVLIGSGLPLFGPETTGQLRLLRSAQLPGGAMHLVYAPAGSTAR